MTSTEPKKFAIIGVGCRMPPSANSLSAFWRFLQKGGDALQSIRGARWDWRSYFDEDRNRPGKTYAPKAAFLSHDITRFDPMAFGISPREAAVLDPQQRLLLEIAWEAFEDAGLPLEKVSGSATSVFIGAFCIDHLVQQVQPSNRHLLTSHSTVGASMTIISNRISHAFNLLGPSLTLDTACSSSLVALHYACQSLRLGEADMAIAGGVNVMTRPEYPIMMSKGHFLSDHGECRTFDESASGYARGEGAGIVLIKPLEKALADGDRIHAVISGTGCNQDGHTDGISLPNSDAQERLLNEVYTRAQVPPAQVDYVEAHGTGTQAGDPAEARALNACFSRGRDTGRKLFVGSVKTNVGHLEAAAGMAGIFKVINILKERQIPKNLHFKNPSPKIPFSEYCLQVADKSIFLPSAAEKPVLYAGVNSFGYGGTNAHVVLESAPVPAVRAKTPDSAKSRVIPFSAASGEALQALAGKFAFLIGQGQVPSLDDLAYTAAFRRSHLEYRCAAVVDDLSQLKDVLIAKSTGEANQSLIEGARANNDANLVFVYTGMGPQWWAMGRELIEKEPVFSDTVSEIDAIFQPLAGWSLREAMLADEASSRMERTEVAQTANFALQVGLTRLWATYGICPVAVVGHSVGEVAAAYVGGIYSLQDAVRVSYHRSRLQQTMAGRGAMLAVSLPQAEAESLIAAYPGVSIAAMNSFSGVTLSGDKDQLGQIAAELEKREVFHRFLRVEVAYHSPQMDPLKEELLQCLHDLRPSAPSVPVYSTTYGLKAPFEDWSAEYWWKNVRQPVRFAEAVRALLADGYGSFLEVGPHPVLGTSIKECAIHLERKVDCFISLKRKEPERKQVLGSLAALYCAGHPVRWEALAPASGALIPSPQYPWQRESYWLESERSKMDRLGLPGSVYLNQSLLSSQPSWEVEINRHYFPFLFDHGVQDQTVFAGMGYIEAALTLNREIHGSEAVILENVSFEKVLIVDRGKLQFLISEYEPEGGRFSISSRTEGEEGTDRHCRGRLVPQSVRSTEKLSLKEVRALCPESVPVEEFYRKLEGRSLFYGPAFRPTKAAWIGEGEAFLVEIDLAQARGDAFSELYPPVLDAAIQPILFRAAGPGLYVPFSFEEMLVNQKIAGGKCFAFGRLTSQTETLIAADVWILNEAGEVCAKIRRIACQRVETDASAKQDVYYKNEWREKAIESRDLTGGDDVLIISPSTVGLAAGLAQALPKAARIYLEDAEAHLQSPEFAARSRIVLLFDGLSVDQTFAEEENFHLVSLLQAIAGSRPLSSDVTLVTRGAKWTGFGVETSNLGASSLSAIGLVAQNEFEQLRFRSIDLSSQTAEGDTEEQWIAQEVIQQTRGDLAYRDGVRIENVLMEFTQEEEAPEVVSVSLEEPLELVVGTKGKVESLCFQPVLRREPGAGEVEIRVQQISLNYKDLLKIEGRIHPVALEETFNGTEWGMECSGTVLRCGPGSRFKPGDRVVSMVPGAFRTYATVPEVFTIPLPSNLDWRAAGIPVVYLAAYRGLVEVARLRRGERVLIHHGTGGVGLAAIDIARWIGAEIFATVGSAEKQAFLAEQGIKQVYSSRNLDFATGIREATGGEGVDVVIGAPVGRAMHLSVNLLRSGGRYIEIGKKDITDDAALPLRAFNRNITFSSVDIDRLMKARPELIHEDLETIFARFADGSFHLGATSVFPAQAVSEPFQQMAKSLQIGKVLVDLSAGEVLIPERRREEALVHSDGAYIVTGGTSGFGMVTAQWLAQRGAGRIVLASRSGSNAPGVGDLVRSLANLGSQVRVVATDMTKAADVAALVLQAKEGGMPLRGVLHGAMVLDDCFLADLTRERFARVFEPKALGALNLVEAVQSEPALDFLVFHSSISSVIGNRGQTSYVAANSLLDHLAVVLRAGGLPATSINWGALGEAGVLARNEQVGAILAAGGIEALSNHEAIVALEQAIRFGQAQVGAFKIDWNRFHQGNPKLADDPRFRETLAGAEENSALREIRDLLAGTSHEQRLRALEGHLQQILAETLRISAEAIALTRKINEMGVDSLMVLELGIGIEKRLGITFSAMELLKGPNLQQLSAMAEKKIWAV